MLHDMECGVLPDERLAKRLALLVEQLSQAPQQSIAQACMMPKPPTVFWGNGRVTHQAIIAGQRQATLKR